MSTFMANAQNVDRKWHVLDAAGKPLGRIASQAAVLLRGKHKTTFTPHADCGDCVIIINAKDAVLTGKKLDQKMYRYHTGYVGGLKEVQYRILMQKDPEKAFMLAVKGMLPHNAIGSASLKRVHIYSGAEHPHQAQNPQPFSFTNV